MVSRHPLSAYNGMYTIVIGSQWSGRARYANEIGMLFYFYGAASGGCRSWSFDFRAQVLHPLRTLYTPCSLCTTSAWPVMCIALLCRMASNVYSVAFLHDQ
jgi:hypothetical protein